jgi:hypothetical protein
MEMQKSHAEKSRKQSTTPPLGEEEGNSKPQPGDNRRAV